MAYLIIGCVGYYRLGSDFDKSKPVTSVLPQDVWTSLANVGLLAHCIIAYMVRGLTCTPTPTPALPLHQAHLHGFTAGAAWPTQAMPACSALLQAW